MSFVLCGSQRGAGADRRRRRMIVAAAGTTFFCGSIALADHFTWTASPGVQSFSDPANWSPSGPPGPFDVAVFGLNQANTVTLSSNPANIALEVLSGSIQLQPDAGATPLTRTYSLSIDSVINGGTLSLSGVPSPAPRDIQMNFAENLYVGGGFFSNGSASGLSLANGSSMNIGLGLKLWNSGSFAMGGGALSVGTFDHTSGGTFQFTGGTLHAGTFLGNLVDQGGTIAPGNSISPMRISGNLQMSSGTIEVEIGGFTPATEYDRIEVNGTASFGTSNVTVKTLNNFIPLPGDVFEVVTFTSGDGNPTILNETGFAGLSFDPTLTPTSLALRAVALYPGDADLNGRVNLLDLIALATHWQSNANWLGGDFDGNGFVDSNDLGLLAQNWQAGVNGPALAEAMSEVGLPGQGVPEPITLGASMAFTCLFLASRPPQFRTRTRSV